MVTAKNERGQSVRRPTPEDIRGLVTKLGRGNTFLIVSNGDRYIQTRLRETGTGKFDLEYRDGAASEHYQTKSVSREKVIAAISSWLADEPGWEKGFKWTNIGHWFSDDAIFVVWNGPASTPKKAEARYQQIQSDEDLVPLGNLDPPLQRFVRRLRRKHPTAASLRSRGSRASARTRHSRLGIVVVFDERHEHEPSSAILDVAMGLGLAFYDIKRGSVSSVP